jgi:hypothetical protein
VEGFVMANRTTQENELHHWVPRIGSASGIVSVVLGLVAAVIVPQPPEMNALFPKIYAYLGGHVIGIETAQLLGMIGSLFALLFIVYLWSVLRTAEGDTGAVSILGLVGGVGSVVIGWVVSGVLLVTVTMTHQNTDGGLHGLYDLVRLLDYFVVVPLILFLAAAAALTLSTRVLPVWLGYGAAVLAAALLVLISVSIFSPSLAQGTVGFILFLLFLAWVAATSVTLTRRAWSQQPRAMVETAPV